MHTFTCAHMQTDRQTHTRKHIYITKFLLFVRLLISFIISSVIMVMKLLKVVYAFQDSFINLGGAKPTRESFLDALSDIDAILIRATHHNIMLSATLHDLTMDTAVPQNTGQRRALIVEQCTCPEGYTGLSCQV